MKKETLTPEIDNGDETKPLTPKENIENKPISLQLDQNFDKMYNTFENTAAPPENIHQNNTVVTAENYQSVRITTNSSNWDMYKGMVYMLFSCLGFTGISFFSKVLLRMKTDLTSYELLTCRTYILFIGASAVCFCSGTTVFSEENIKPAKLKHIIIRSVLATITISFLIFSIKFIDASDVYTIFYCYPAFVVILSLVFTRDIPKMMDYFCLVCCFVGVICVVQPAFIFGEHKKAEHEMNKTLYFVLALLASFTKSTEVVLVRDIMGAIQFLIFPLFFAFFGLILFPIPMIIDKNISFQFSLKEFIVLSCISVSSWCYHSFMALSLKYENVGRASMINYLQIPILLIADLLLFDKKADFLGIFGSMLIFTFNFGNGICKAFERVEKLEILKNEANDLLFESGSDNENKFIRNNKLIAENIKLKEKLGDKVDNVELTEKKSLFFKGPDGAEISVIR